MKIRSALVLPPCASSFAFAMLDAEHEKMRFQSVLNASQLKKFEVLMEEEHGPGRGGHGGGHP